MPPAKMELPAAVTVQDSSAHSQTLRGNMDVEQTESWQQDAAKWWFDCLITRQTASRTSLGSADR